MAIKKLLFSGILATTLLSSSAYALIAVDDLPDKGAYFTGWGQTEGAAQKFIDNARDTSFSAPGSRINLFLLAFLRWDGLGYIKDDNAFVYSADPYWKSNAYKELRKIYTAVHDGTIPGKKTKFIVSFGGYSYAGMWDVLLEDDLRETLARNLVALMGGKIGKFWDGYKDIEGFSVDGIDLDFERSIRITPELNDALILLVERVRELQQDDIFLNNIGISKDSVKDDIITLTTYHVGVDPVNCTIDTNLGPSDGCSYVNDKRSIHNGEVTRLFEKIRNKNLFDLYNIMEYDAGQGKDFHPEVSIDNYLKYVPANRLLAGISIKEQWGPDGKFTRSRPENAGFINLYKSKNLRGFFIWSIGGIPKTPSEDIETHYYFAKVWENLIPNPTRYTPTSFQPTGAKIQMKTESILGRDHTEVSRNGKNYIVIGSTWYNTSSSGTASSSTINIESYTFLRWPGLMQNILTYSCPSSTNSLDVSSFMENRQEILIVSSDNNWCRDITIPKANEKMKGKIINVFRSSGADTRVNGNPIEKDKFTRYTYE